MRAISIPLLVVGCLWVLVVVWIFLSLAGLSESVSTVKIVSYYAGMLIGPLLLIAGALSVMRGAFLKMGATMVVVGCMILTGFVFYQSVMGLRQQPLEMRPPYLVYAIGVAVAIACDLGALLLSRRVFSAGGALNNELVGHPARRIGRTTGRP